VGWRERIELERIAVFGGHPAMTEDSNGDPGNGSEHNQDPHKGLYHLVYVFGATVFMTVVDFMFFWSEGHLAALIILATGFSLIAIYELRARKARAKWIILLVIGFYAVAAITYCMIGPIRTPDIEVTGSLQPGNEPTPTNACSPAQAVMGFPHDALTFLVGDNAAMRTSSEKAVLLQIGECRVVSMEKIGNDVSVDAVLYDTDGKLIATVTNGKIDALEGENSHISRNGDLTQLTVTNGQGVEIFHEQYLNRTTMRVRGVFGCPGHSLVAVTDNKIMDAATGAATTTGGNCIINWGVNAAAIGIK
jgi:hypothetical protein